MSEKPKGNPLLTFGVLLLLLALGGIGAEFWARSRWTEAQLVMVLNMPFLEDDPLLLWRLRPNLDMQVEGHRMQTNSLGMRDDPVGEKQGFRILSLGESSTWGYGVEGKETYTEVLSSLLSRPDRPVDALNAGVPAWSIYQSFLYLTTEGAALHPDLVLLYHLQNDLLPRGSNPRDPFDVRRSDRELSEARRPLASILGWLSHSRLRQALWHFYLAPRLAGGSPPPNAPDVLRVPESDRLSALDGIARFCAEHQIKLAIAKPVYGRGNHAEDRLLNRYAASHPEVQFIDLPALKQQQAQADFFQKDDAHPTPEGHRWIAAQLAAALEIP